LEPTNCPSVPAEVRSKIIRGSSVIMGEGMAA
jgi:hypothetical protein